MPGLTEVVQALAGRDGVEGVVVASADGLTIDRAAAPGVDADALAALTATLAQHASRLGEAAGRGELGTAVLEHDAGLLLASRAGAAVWLLLLVRPDTNLGPLLYDLRRHRPALAELFQR